MKIKDEKAFLANLDANGIPYTLGFPTMLEPAVVTELPKYRPPVTQNYQTMTLPLPPPLSALTNNFGRRRIESRRYKAWKAESATVLASGIPMRTPVEVTVTIHPGKGWRKNCDVCNREKAVLDALVAHGVLPDDNWQHVRRVTLEYEDRPVDKGAQSVVVVTIRSL